MVSSVSNITQTGQASNASKSLASTYETFLSLLTAQVKNQDPLSPMDTTEWTNQLVQYSSVEQQIKSNDYLKSIAEALGDNLSSLSASVGQYAEAQGDSAVIADGKATWAYQLAAPAQTVEMLIKDTQGRVVSSQNLNAVASGSHGFVWDAKSASGEKLLSGTYHLSLKAKDQNGEDIAASVRTSGIISAVEQGSDGLKLYLNQTPVAANTITKIAKTSPLAN